MRALLVGAVSVAALNLIVPPLAGRDPPARDGPGATASAVTDSLEVAYSLMERETSHHLRTFHPSSRPAICIVPDTPFAPSHLGALPPATPALRSRVGDTLEAQGYRMLGPCPERGKVGEDRRYVDAEGNRVAHLLLAGPLRVGDGWAFHVGSFAGPMAGGGRACLWTMTDSGDWESTRCRGWET